MSSPDCTSLERSEWQRSSRPASWRDVAAAVTRLRRHVELLPPRLDLAGRLRSFDAIVMPSRFEGLGLVAIEALCAGVPVLATNAPGLNEALPDWYPGRCAVDDPAALAAMISGFVRDVGQWRADAEVARPWAAIASQQGR
jgi:glycosyltransferase involved in cell wall biosynthesis